MPNIMSTEALLNSSGMDLGVSPWFEIDQERINQFADVTIDHQFIHVDEKLAARTPFGGTIAHGFLTLSLISHLCQEIAAIPENVKLGLNYGFDKVRFLAPVRSGKSVRMRAVLQDVQQKEGNRLLVTQGITIEIQGEETPALVCEWLSMYVCGD